MQRLEISSLVGKRKKVDEKIYMLILVGLKYRKPQQYLKLEERHYFLMDKKLTVRITFSKGTQLEL